MLMKIKNRVYNIPLEATQIITCDVIKTKIWQEDFLYKQHGDYQNVVIQKKISFYNTQKFSFPSKYEISSKLSAVSDIPFLISNLCLRNIHLHWIQQL